MQSAANTGTRSTASFPWLALGSALLLALVVARLGVYADPQQRVLPLLMLLLMAEFGALLALAGTVTGALRLRRQGFAWPVLLATLGCAVAAVALAWMGWTMWPGT